MTKKILLFAVMALFAVSSVMAQDSIPEKKDKKPSKFGSFVRRVGEATTGINMSDETFAVLPFKAQSLIKMEVVSCVGNSETGTVLLTLAVIAKQDKVKTDLGKSCGNGNQECVTAKDTKGKTFEGQEVGSISQIGAKENPKGTPVEYQFKFSTIPSTMTEIEVVLMEFYIHGNTNVGSNMSDIDPIQVRNIPIQWDAVSE